MSDVPTLDLSKFRTRLDAARNADEGGEDIAAIVEELMQALDSTEADVDLDDFLAVYDAVPGLPKDPDLERARDVASRRQLDEHRELLEEYDFSGGTRGKYAQRYAQGSNVVVLDPGVAARFKTPREVNEALRRLIREEADED